jgi:hypothetical protein
MKKMFLAAMMVAGFASPAFAQDTAALCRLIGAGGSMLSGAAYQPGVDVHGRPVVPADVNAGIGSDTDTVKIPLSIDLAKRLHVPRGTEMETPAGTIEIHKDGTVTSGGMDLTARSHAICGMPDIAPPVPSPVAKVAAPKTPIVTPPAAPVIAPPAPVSARTAGQTSAALNDAVKPADLLDPKTYMPRAGSVSSDAGLHDTVDEIASDAIKPHGVSKGDSQQDISTRDGLIWGQGN